MSTVIWVNYLKEGRVSSDESDKWAVYRFAGKLDRVCGRIGVRKLSDFHDTTDAEANLAPELGRDDAGVDTYRLMAEQGQWFDPDEGLAVLGKLLGELRAHPVHFGILSDRYTDVMADLEECERSIQKAKADGSRFHLCVVM